MIEFWKMKQNMALKLMSKKSQIYINWNRHWIQIWGIECHWIKKTITEKLSNWRHEIFIKDVDVVEKKKYKFLKQFKRPWWKFGLQKTLDKFKILENCSIMMSIMFFLLLHLKNE